MTTTVEEDLFTLFRDTFRTHPAGVTVVTTLDAAGNPVGFTASSVASFSAQPPRLTLNVIMESKAWPAVEQARRLVVNFLSIDQAEVGARFAGPFEERFDGEHWFTDTDGLPKIVGAKGTLVTEVAQMLPMETNAVLVLEIVGGAADDAIEPLLYHNRRFCSLAEISE